MNMTSRIDAYLAENFAGFVDQLNEWLAIPSISSLPEHKDDVLRAANWAREKISAIGFPTAKTIVTEGHPLVLAEWCSIPDQPTLLIYGHYDVQPVDPLAEWQSPPFSPTLREGNLYCRGASDDKGQVFLVLAALEAWVKCNGAPPVNIRIILEGEEEAGGASIATFVKNSPEQLNADAALICDTHMISDQQPCLINGLRGILYTEITLTGARTDLHSGSYGGVAPNPIHALCLLIGKLKGEDGIINIPELETVIPIPSPVEKKFWSDDPLNIADSLRREMGVTEFVGEQAYPPLERIGLRPTLEVHGIKGGFTGEGAKTVIPARATAKISLRLPPAVDPDQVFSWLHASVKRLCPAGYSIAVTNLHAGRGLFVKLDNMYMQAAAASLETVFGKPPVYLREGGSIPIAALFDEALNVPVVLMGFGLPDDTIHAPNEKFSLEQLRLGMRTVADFLGRLKNDAQESS